MEQALHILDLILYVPIAFSVVYVTCFAIPSRFSVRRQRKQHAKQYRFLVVVPAYAEDAVIVDSVTNILQQDYPASLFTLMVVSDHMQPSTNASLQSLPLTLLIADYHPSSKAKALQLAMASSSGDYDWIVILDADNHINPNFLSELNTYCHSDLIALQAHRMAKNTNTPVALLDALSEEINNTIFRKGHNAVGMSAALIGSGMCLQYEWFEKHVNHLSTAGEDKEIEECLLREHHSVLYLEDLPVYDEKVQNSANFGNQRKRWMAAQLYSMRSLLNLLPEALHTANLNLIDKFLQHLLIPRSICLCLCTFLTFVILPISFPYALKWLFLSLILCFSLLLSIPLRYYHKSFFIAILHIPLLVFRMLLNLFQLKGAATHFIHTKHGKDK